VRGKVGFSDSSGLSLSARRSFSAFGESGKNNIRISYAYSLKHLTEAANRIERFLQHHRG